MERLTHRAQDSDIDHSTMSLVGLNDDGVIVCFDGDADDTATMSMDTYDRLTQSEAWKMVGFSEE